MKRRVLLVTMLVGLMGLVVVPLRLVAADPPITLKQVRDTILDCGLKSPVGTYEFDRDDGRSRVENIALLNATTITFDLVRNDGRVTFHSMYRQGTNWEGDLTFGTLCMRPLEKTAAIN